MPTAQSAPELARYLDLELAALGQPTAPASADAAWLETVGPLLRGHRQKNQLLGQYLCPADVRIQSFLDAYLHGVSLGGAPRLPSDTFVLDRAGLARLMSLPRGRNTFSSPYLRSYRVRQGILHNPLSDRRTTQGAFHISEDGFPSPLRRELERVSSPSCLREPRGTIGADPFHGQMPREALE